MVRGPWHLSADHPRIRGEHAGGAQHVPGARGSSPHTRGARRRPAYGRPRRGIIPAYAGSTPRRSIRPFRDADHPRIRGEHVFAIGVTFFLIGSSPHTRGAPIPLGAPAWTAVDHPRIRGEHQVSFQCFARGPGSSPHTRGAQECSAWEQPRIRIIPAYAGSTRRHHAMRGASSDHPRIRGEHWSEEPIGVGPGGSSPHTRGAHDRRRVALGREGIIPAYAGSTSPGSHCR